MPINIKLRTIFIISLIPLLQACTAYHNYVAEQNAKIYRSKLAYAKKQCQTDWENTAAQYALSGQSSDAGLQYYQQYCGQYELSIDRKTWQTGYARGNQSYCGLTQAYQTGKNGNPFNPQRCSTLNASARNSRVDANRYGLYMAEQQRLLKQSREEADSLNDKIKRTQNQLSTAEKNNDQSQIKSLHSEIRQQQRELTRLQHRMNTQETELLRLDLDYRNRLILKEQGK